MFAGSEKRQLSKIGLLKPYTFLSKVNLEN